ncbi:NnrU family protein [Pseudogemmobacter sonorensis]|uniref:NnrU family protein n=1 Tax=Pseudogemmobacter sonorensis TaxID=2989681 RepID=UPI0036823D5E
MPSTLAMPLIASGVLLWSVAHLLRRIAPGLRARMGRGGGLALTGALGLAGTLAMVVGYRAAGGEVYWGRSPARVGANNLLMLLAVWLFAALGMKTAPARWLRHPMLWGVVLWMVAHLLVNGDTPSFLLFGGIGLWALVQMWAINATAGPWVPPAPAGVRREMLALIGALAVYAALAGVHYLFGYAAFG